jgi:hypothetical protein
MATASKADRDKALEYLREYLKPGDTVYTILRHVSRSGMARDIGVVAMVNGEPYAITHLVAQVMGLRQSDVGMGSGVRVTGAGMDMGFSIAYDLAWAMFGDGYTLKHRWL